LKQQKVEVWLLTSRSAFDGMCGEAHFPPSAFWLAAGLLTDAELAVWRTSGADVSVFGHAIDSHDVDEVADAIDTIEQHHPACVVRCF
jgi:hypothetical protein